MTTTFSAPDAFNAIQHAIDTDNLSEGDWDCCMMHHAANGAQSVDECVTAGWPKWLANVNVELFDPDIGVPDERKARAQFALDVTRLLLTDRDTDRAHDLFVAATLRQLPEQKAIDDVIALYERRAEGGVVTDDEWEAARAAADDAACAAAYDAARADLITALSKS